MTITTASSNYPVQRGEGDAIGQAACARTAAAFIFQAATRFSQPLKVPGVF